MTDSENNHPTEIRLRRTSRLLCVTFADGNRFELPAEYLRVYSPSAEVRGHGAGEAVLVTGKERVNIERIEPVGNYAVRLVFDDGHSTGLYSWRTLHELGSKYEYMWPAYLKRLEEAGRSRDPDASEP